MSKRFRTTDLDTVPNRPDTTTLYTMYVVRDANKRQFLNQRTYTGSTRGVWGLLGEAHLFQSEARAQSCASSISRRNPGCRQPEVKPVLVTRRRTIA
jgi:hypothetical protein